MRIDDAESHIWILILVDFIFVDNFHDDFAVYNLQREETIFFDVSEYFVGDVDMNAGRSIDVNIQFWWIVQVRSTARVFRL